MKALETREMKSVEGGKFLVTFFAGVSAGITFIIGFIDGYVNPKRCYS